MILWEHTAQVQGMVPTPPSTRDEVSHHGDGRSLEPQGRVGMGDPKDLRGRREVCETREGRKVTDLWLSRLGAPPELGLTPNSRVFGTVSRFGV